MGRSKVNQNKRVRQPREKVDWNTTATNIAPYASNIINSFRKPPMPSLPGSIANVRPAYVNDTDALNDANRSVRGLNNNLDATLDPNTAAAAKMGTLASSLDQRGRIKMWKANTNAQATAQAAQVNASIDAQNIGLGVDYDNKIVDRGIAMQREQSENVANAADKFMEQKAQSDAKQLDMARMDAYKPWLNKDGVFDRYQAQLTYDIYGNPIPAAKKGFGGTINPNQAVDPMLDKPTFARYNRFRMGGRVSPFKSV